MKLVVVMITIMKVVVMVRVYGSRVHEQCGGDSYTHDQHREGDEGEALPA